MKPSFSHSSPILETLAELYEASTAGKTGIVARDFGEPYSRLLNRAKATSGDALTLAVKDLLTAESAGALRIERHRRSHNPERVCVPVGGEAKLFKMIGRISPTQVRNEWAETFKNAARFPVPDKYREAWSDLCVQREKDVLVGKGLAPFRWEHRRRAEAQLKIVAELLNWTRPCFLRTVSAQISGSSKFFERCLTTLESLLIEASGGALQSLRDLKIEPNPTKVQFHGSIRLRIKDQIKDYVGFQGESALSEVDLALADAIEFDGPRCVSIENATTFHELCKQGCTDLLVFTSYSNQATVTFLKRLPENIRLHHWGDTDPWGFDVLRDLRQKTDRFVQPLNMNFGNWAETLPAETRARRELTLHDRERLNALLKNEAMRDVWEVLLKISEAGSTGDFEQEGLLFISPEFPYIKSEEKGAILGSVLDA